MAAKAKKVDTIDAQTLAVDYGFAYTLLKSNPELNKIFGQAVAGTWTTDRFVAALRGTKWFQHTSDTAREWTILAASDRQTANQRLQARKDALSAESAQLGVTLTPAQLSQYATQSILYGWTDQQVRKVLGTGYRYSPTTPQAGLAGQSLAQLKATAASYAIPVADQTLGNWTQRIIEGLATADDFKAYATNQAKSLYPGMSDALDKGMTVDDYADPYRQAAAQLTGINPADVNWLDPKWNAALNQVDPKTGQRTTMGLADWNTKLMTDKQYGYDNSANGRQKGASFATSLGKMFGANV